MLVSLPFSFCGILPEFSFPTCIIFRWWIEPLCSCARGVSVSTIVCAVAAVSHRRANLKGCDSETERQRRIQFRAKAQTLRDAERVQSTVGLSCAFARRINLALPVACCWWALLTDSSPYRIASSRRRECVAYHRIASGLLAWPRWQQR